MFKEEGGFLLQTAFHFKNRGQVPLPQPSGAELHIRLICELRAHLTPAAVLAAGSWAPPE